MSGSAECRIGKPSIVRTIRFDDSQWVSVDLEGVVSESPVVNNAESVALPFLNSEDGPRRSRATLVSPTTIDQTGIGDAGH